MVLPALENGEYAFELQVNIGERLGTGRHNIDALATKDGQSFLISMKWQQTSGTAEQKVPFELICLVEAMERGEYKKAYLVLGGEGWKPKLKALYTSGGLSEYIRGTEQVEILTLEGFVAKANQGKL